MDLTLNVYTKYVRSLCYPQTLKSRIPDPHKSTKHFEIATHSYTILAKSVWQNIQPHSLVWRTHYGSFWASRSQSASSKPLKPLVWFSERPRPNNDPMKHYWLNYDLIQLEQPFPIAPLQQYQVTDTFFPLFSMFGFYERFLSNISPRLLASRIIFREIFHIKYCFKGL